MAFVKYDATNKVICGQVDDNFGRVCEEDVTEQVLQATFRYLMSYGLPIAEYCEYEVDGNKFRISLVKENT